MAMLREWARGVGRFLRTGRLAPFPPDFEPDEIATIEAVAPFTMTSPERLVGLIRAVRHVVENQVAGDVVECGVWKGGSIMAVARTLLRQGAVDRKLWLFD